MFGFYFKRHFYLITVSETLKVNLEFVKFV